MPRVLRLMPVLILTVGVLLAGSGAANAGTVQSPAAMQLTPLIVSTTNAPLAVLGSDGLEHLEYDLVLTNVFYTSLTLSSLDVTAADGSALLHLAGDTLAADTQAIAVSPIGRPAPISEIPAGGAVATVIDLVLPPGAMPARIGHRITYELPTDAPGLALLASRTVSGPDLAVDSRAPLHLAPPVQGAGWLDANGCCNASANHRYIRLVVDGTRYIKPETFAIDYLRLQDGRMFSGDGSQNEQYVGFGASIVSVAAGTVVSIRDGMPDAMPGQPSDAVKQLGDYLGNHVVVQIQPNVWAVYAHLQLGSIAVQVGDRVTADQLLGRLGNSGNSFAPHLHFQLSDGPEVLASNSVPFVFEHYVMAGAVDQTVDDEPAETGVAAPRSEPTSLPIVGTPTDQTGTYPLTYSVQDFH